MSKFLIIGLLYFVAVMMIYLFYYNRWKVLWELEEARPIYPVWHYGDDTIRLILIGDSWIEMHTDLQMDSLLQRQIEQIVSKPVMVSSKGKGGKRSRGIYDLMFNSEAIGLKTLIEGGADYCIISAGINDASANLGVKQFCHYMRLIIDFLLANDIRPVIIEVPDVNIGKVFWRRPIRNLVIDYMRSLMTNCRIYHYAEYREALKSMLVGNHLLEKVVYVYMDSWNTCSPQLDKHLFLDDQLHLNRDGYIQMDLAISSAIANDYMNRHVNNEKNK